MKYQGSKNRFAKEILPIILKNRKPNQFYVEPFVGAFNLIQWVDGNRIANDSNEYLIELFKAIQQGYEPPQLVSEELYNNIKNNQQLFDKSTVGFVGFACSFGSKWFGGYARGKNSKGNQRNYALESYRNIMKQKPLIQDISIYNLDYRKLVIPRGSIIYCDPPYFNTTKYKDSIDSVEFWDWCREMSKENTIFISEYSAPEDFICVWEKKVNENLSINNSGKRIEKLFTIQ